MVANVCEVAQCIVLIELVVYIGILIIRAVSK